MQSLCSVFLRHLTHAPEELSCEPRVPTWLEIWEKMWLSWEKSTLVTWLGSGTLVAQLSEGVDRIYTPRVRPETAAKGSIWTLFKVRRLKAYGFSGLGPNITACLSVQKGGAVPGLCGTI